MNAPYNDLREVLLRYVTATIVDGILFAACSHAKTTPAAINKEKLEHVIHELSPGIRLFCKPCDIPRLMLELAALLE